MGNTGQLTNSTQLLGHRHFDLFANLTHNITGVSVTALEVMARSSSERTDHRPANEVDRNNPWWFRDEPSLFGAALAHSDPL